MTERYYQRDFEELYYIIDSQVISEEEFDEKEMYEGYTAFEDSMTGEEIVDLLNENEQLKKELSEYKDFVLSDDKILCYTCLFCTHKGIYEVDCDVKGHVDVHGTCHSYVKKELRE